MPSLNHVHTYVKYRNRPGYFRCADSKCTHIADKEFVTGKASLCTQCGEEFILTTDDVRRSRPRCLNCSDTKKAKAHKIAQAAIAKRFAGVTDTLRQFDPGDDKSFEDKLNIMDYEPDEYEEKA